MDFENREGLFPNIDSRIKFSLLTMARDVNEPAFTFFLTDPAQMFESERCFTLSPAQIARINPNTKTAPVFRSRADAELTAKIYGRVPVLVDETKGTAGNPWRVTFHSRLWHMAEDSNWFRTPGQLQQAGFNRSGSLFQSSTGSSATERYVPVYEAKMIHQFDHRWSTYGDADSRNVTRDEKRDATFEPSPRYWVPEDEVSNRLSAMGWTHDWLIGWRNICRATDERTVIASVVPRYAVGHSMPLFFPKNDERPCALLLSNLCSLVLDYVARQKVGGVNLTFGFFKQFPVLLPDHYTELDVNFLIPRIVELTYTSHSMAPFAQDLGCDGPPFSWDEDRRAQLRAEIDAWYARAYGLNRDELLYILDPAEVKGEGYPSETFRVLKYNEIRQFGNYRTRDLVLDAWDKMERGGSLDLSSAIVAQTGRAAVKRPPVTIDPATLPDNAWAAASDSPDATLAQLAALVKALPGPVPVARVRLAALYALEPRYLTRRLQGAERTTWRRLVGAAAEPATAANVAGFAPKIDTYWRDAVTQLRGMRAIVEDVNAQTWAPGVPVKEFETTGWPDGRAAFVLRVLESMTIDEATVDLPAELQAWVKVAYAA